MTRSSFHCDDLGPVLTRLGGDAALSASAFEHKAFRRPRGVRSAGDLLRLLLMYGPGGLSLRGVAAAAAQAAIADVSDVALLNRFRGAADWLEALCGQVLQASGASAAACAGGSGLTRMVSIVDASVIKAPGQATAYRLHLQWDAQRQRIGAAMVTTTKTGERLDRLASAPGALVMADRGYPQPDGLRRTCDSGADVLVRVTWNSLTLTDAAKQPLDWLALCQQARAGGVDMPIQVRKARGSFEPLAMRLVMIPKPAAAAQTSRRAARRTNRKGGRKTIDPRTVACADFLMVLTTLARADFPAAQLGALYRLRWQVELLFKRLKSLLRLDRLPAKDPALARAWLQAHLLAALLAEDAIAQADGFSP